MVHTNNRGDMLRVMNFESQHQQFSFFFYKMGVTYNLIFMLKLKYISPQSKTEIIVKCTYISS